MAEIKTDNLDLSVGQIQISDEVIAIIAGTAAMEIEGVAGMAGNISDLAELLGRKNLSKGVKVDVQGEEVEFEINLLVKSGYKIQEVAKEVQVRVKTAIETMTGLSAPVVNVNITGVVMDKKSSNKNNELDDLD